MEWIDTKYELPEPKKNEYVLALVCVNMNGFYMIPMVAEYRTEGEWHSQTGEIIGGGEYSEIAYWMPIPKFPTID